jgi:alpha-methylacyl-CoA racemase
MSRRSEADRPKRGIKTRKTGIEEAPNHPNNQARGTFVTVDDIVQPAPAPRLSRTPPAIQCPPPLPGADTEAVLRDWGFEGSEIIALRMSGVIE